MDSHRRSKLLHLHETEFSSVRKGKSCQHATLPHRVVNELELLLVAHPGEFGLVSGDRNAFLIISGRARGHDYDGSPSGSGRRGARALRAWRRSGSPSAGGIQSLIGR